MKYWIRYVKRPNPIIVGNLDGLEIDNKTTSTLEVPPVLHRDIVTKAVELAITTRGGRTEK
jgi:hypothetical protein